VDRDDLAGIGRGERHLALAEAWLAKTVMNSDSPTSRRLPAPSSAPTRPPCWLCCEPSPKIVSIAMPSSMYIMPPASATTASPGSSSIFTNWRSSPRTS
jgi:hypothetical protein